MKLRFLIAAPPYSHQSGGIMILHDLCDMLNRQGYEAAMVIFHGGVAPHFQWACSNNKELYHPNHQRVNIPLDNPDQAVRDFLENGVIVYPDLIPDNPLGAKRVVRYLLYKNHDYTQQSPDEYILSFSKLYHDHPNGYLFKMFTDDNLHTTGSVHWTQRTMDLTYFGKGPVFTECFKIPETVVISRTWPEDKNQLGILLRHCRYFFTWDSMTATNVDAILCGAIPVLLHEHQASDDEFLKGELGPFPKIKLTNFQDKNSIVGNFLEIDQQRIEMANKVLWYKNSWGERVREFALSASQYFQFD